MLEKHKTSRLAHACGLLLCASVAVFAVAQPSAELSHAAPWEDQPITLNFEQVPLATVVSTVFQFGGQTPSGLDQLPTTPVNIRIKDVPLKGALGVLLGCNGYTWQAKDQGYEILRAKNDAKVTDPARCMREAQSNAK